MRLIDADALKKEMLETYEHEYPTASGAFDEFASRIVPNIISNAHTVDAEPIRRGHWEWFEEWSESNTEHYAECENAGWKCSACGSLLDDMVGGHWDDMDDTPKLNYCPNCGAKMG